VPHNPPTATSTAVAASTHHLRRVTALPHHANIAIPPRSSYAM
jgi:hypothetical protein